MMTDEISKPCDCGGLLKAYTYGGQDIMLECERCGLSIDADQVEADVKEEL